MNKLGFAVVLLAVWCGSVLGCVQIGVCPTGCSGCSNSYPSSTTVGGQGKFTVPAASSWYCIGTRCSIGPNAAIKYAWVDIYRTIAGVPVYASCVYNTYDHNNVQVWEFVNCYDNAQPVGGVLPSSSYIDSSLTPGVVINNAINATVSVYDYSGYCVGAHFNPTCA